MNLSNFSERLSELLFDARLNPPAFAKMIGCSRGTINRYLSGRYVPTLDMLLRMADALNCTTDFLLALEPENYQKTFKPVPPFKDRIREVAGELGMSLYRIQKITRIPETVMYYWTTGDTVPTVENLVKMAEALGCSVDFIIGRS